MQILQHLNRSKQADSLEGKIMLADIYLFPFPFTVAK